MKRRVTVVKLEAAARCLVCDWESNSLNALATAARHHDATGHAVETVKADCITYGDPHAQPAEQTQMAIA